MDSTMKDAPPEGKGAVPVTKDVGNAEAEKFKDEANKHFGKKEYKLAIDSYSKAIEMDPNVAPYFGNRSFAYLRTEMFGAALQDATSAITLDPSYIKGYYRRAAAYMGLTKFKLALRDLEAVVKVRPNDADAKLKHQECKKIVQRLAFEKAIAVDEVKVCVSSTISVDEIDVETSYTGPRLKDDKLVTKEFLVDLLETFKRREKLHRKYAYQILLDIKAYFEKQPSLVSVNIPPESKFTVCGDIHGQFYDLVNIFSLNGLPSETNPYLFNGDFVDRGSFSVECIFTLFGFKLLLPDHFFLARGNHETETMNQMYGFEGEVKAKYSDQMAHLFTEVYNYLPLCHLLNDKVLVMHGGLFSKDDVTLDDIRKVDRNRQPPEEGLMCELLWSDPQPERGRAPSKRGVGIQFGPDVTDNFLRHNDLSYVIRSHEVKPEGYEVAHDGKCITIFSAPNYCDTMGNKGAFITMNGRDLNPSFVSYDAVPHPDVKPMAYANRLMSLFT
ncbi:unnamed protein product [Notodromas monacha]|uniref:protein-serine/threonine phosphatase n=1 Tax=Notodromas monacha TaxID=399045 RepID=A0A7R9BGL5_9CRUS|nr:unnamed protein product [Notodromas monacha]CAG0913741.1 unnamed protein product [Notodromas monacha]